MAPNEPFHISPWELAGLKADVRARIEANDAAYARMEARCQALETIREAGYSLSTWAATINREPEVHTEAEQDGRTERNTAAWLDGLRERIEAVQALYRETKGADA